MDRFRAADVLMIGEVSDGPAELYEKLGDLIHRSSQIRADVVCFSTENGQYRVLLRGTLDEVQPDEEPDQSPSEPLPPALDDFTGEIEPPKADEPAAT